MVKTKSIYEEGTIGAKMLVGLNHDVVSSVRNALVNELRFEARLLIEPLRPPEIADLLQLLKPDLRQRLVEYLRPDFDPKILSELDSRPHLTFP